jgi:hypothetical protein
MSVNEITGATQQTKPATPAYKVGWDFLFGRTSCATCKLTDKEKVGPYGCEHCHIKEETK